MKVIVADPIHEKGIAALQENGFTVILPEETGLESVLRDAEALIVRSRTKVTREVLSGAHRLKCIVRAGSGVDNIDIEAARERGVRVMNVPGANSIAVAEHALALMLAISRKLAHAHASMVGGAWKKKELLGRELYGKTLGIIGFGRIGREVAKRARVFGMEVLAHDPFVHEAEGTQLVSLQELLKQSDYVSVHAAMTGQTRNLINAERLALMKPEAVLINCSRGALVEEPALFQALREGRIGGAALDVFEEEGDAIAQNPLISLDNVMLTPHIAGSTKEAQERIGLIAAQQVIAALNEGKFENQVS